MTFYKALVLATVLSAVITNLAYADAAALAAKASEKAATLPAEDAAKLAPALDDFQAKHEKAGLFGSASHGFSMPPCIAEAAFDDALVETRQIAALTALLFDKSAPSLQGWVDPEEIRLLADEGASIALAALTAEPKLDPEHCVSRPGLLSLLMGAALRAATGSEDQDLAAALVQGSAFFAD